MGRALLDINVLIALLDQGHLLHRPATRWLERHLAHGWATCPITENRRGADHGPTRLPHAQPAALVAARLAEACSHSSHAFWPEPISLLQEGLIRWERLLGPRQITDAYLLALAASQGGCFASFDQRISLDLVPSAGARHLCLIPCS